MRRVSSMRSARRRTAPLVLATLLMFAGCAVDEQAGVERAQQLVYARTNQAVHWFRDAGHNAQVHQALKTLLDKPVTMTAAEKIALLNNKKLQGTFERLGIAQADLFQAGLIANPHIGVAVRFPTTGDFVPMVDGDFGLNFLSIFTVAARTRVARAQLDAVLVEVADIVLGTVFDVRKTYLTLMAAQQLYAINHTIANAAQGSYDTAKALHEAGNVTDLQLAQEQALYEQTRLDLIDAQGAVLEAREDLNALMGLWGYQAQTWRVDAKLRAVPRDEVKLDQLTTLAVSKRLDLAAMRKRTVVLAEALRMAGDWAWLHHFSVGASLETEDGLISVGPAVSVELPIFDQGQGRTARLRAQLRQSYHHVTTKAVQIRADVRKLRNRLMRHRRRSIHYRDVVIPLRERIVALTMERYNFMLVGTFDLLEKKRQEARAYRDYLLEVRDYWITRSELARAVGGVLPEKKHKPIPKP